MAVEINSLSSAVKNNIFQLATITTQCEKIFDHVSSGKSDHWILDFTAFDKVCEFVVFEIKKNYPTLAIPVHSRMRHFESLMKTPGDFWKDSFYTEKKEDQGSILFSLTLISVLLDAGAGETWSYTTKDGKKYTRSEGLAMASLDLFLSGFFANHKEKPYYVDSKALTDLTLEKLSKGLQVSDSNPLIGLPNRLKVLNQLGNILEGKSLKVVYEDLILKHKDGVKNSIKAESVFEFLVQFLLPIWPNQLVYGGEKLGDAYLYKPLKGVDGSDFIVPFHKISMWLTYSVCEVLELDGLTVTGSENLGGLPEYRNGGLFLDFKLICFKNNSDLTLKHEVSSELVVELRAITNVFLKRVRDRVNELLDLKKQLTLGQVLQGGTWSAGRKIAKILRPESAGSPIQINNEGTLF